MDNNRKLLSIKDLDILSLDEIIELYKKGYTLEDYKPNIDTPPIGPIFGDINSFAHFGLGVIGGYEGWKLVYPLTLIFLTYQIEEWNLLRDTILPDIFEYVIGLGTGALIKLFKENQLNKEEIIKELKEDLRKLEKPISSSK